MAARQAESLSQLHPAEVFVEVLTTLVTQGRVRFLDVCDTPSSESEMIGWRRGDLALVIPDAAYRRVAMFVRESGEHWGPSLRELHKDLVQRKYLLATRDGRDGAQWRVGADRKKKRGWLMPLAVVGLTGSGGGGPDVPPGRLHSRDDIGGEDHAPKLLNLEGKLNGHHPVPPLAPGQTSVRAVGLHAADEEV